MDKAQFRKQRQTFAEKSIDELMDLLASDNLRTRFMAEMCLRDATST